MCVCVCINYILILLGPPTKSSGFVRGSKIMNSQVVWSCYRWEQLHLKAWKICCKVFTSALGVQTGQHVRQQLMHWPPWHCIQVFWFRIKLPPHWQCLSLAVLTRWLLQSFLKLSLSVAVLYSCLSLSLSLLLVTRCNVFFFFLLFFFNVKFNKGRSTYFCLWPCYMIFLQWGPVIVYPIDDLCFSA